MPEIPTAPTWARGYDLEWLREIAALYKAEFGPHTYGQFGIPKERDVADAFSGGELMWKRTAEGNKPVTGAAIFRRVSRPSPHKDFSDRVATMRPDDLFIRSIVGLESAKRAMLARAILADPPAVWVEAHVEIEETVALLAELGFRRVLTKVAASSDLKGLFLRLAADQSDTFRVPGGFSAADQIGVRVLEEGFLSEAEHGAILGELVAHLRHKPDAFAQHYSGYNKGKTWSAFALRGYDHGDPGFIVKPSEMSKAWKAENGERLAAACGPTIAAPFFDATWAALDRLPGEFQRVRFMRLAPSGGELTRHADITDPEAGTKDGEIARLHIPLVSEEACAFRCWRLDGREERLHMPERALCYLDTRKPHAVINPAATERVHLVVDIRASDALRAMITG